MPNSDSTQQQVLEFLMTPAAHGGVPVHRIDTHGASVFLAGDRALKVKRAVRFSYLDYSTLELRKTACDQELSINRLFAPRIYRRVAAVTRSADGTLAIDGDGEVVEWAVEMLRFDERQTLDHVAEAAEPAAAVVVATADVIAASHAAAPVAAAAPWMESIDRIIAGNTKAFRAETGFAQQNVEQLEVASQKAFARVCDLLAQRGQSGCVRRCHGDLHLANIVLIDRQPVLFDAIEFDPQIASTDVLYDLAFTLMDFLHYDRPVAANLLFNRYLAITPQANLSALAALPLLMSMRAAIRANVMLARGQREGANANAIRPAAEAYFALALRLIAPPPPRLVAVGGLSGTGKSLLARSLAGFVAPAPGAVVLRSDVIRKRQFQVEETQRLPAEAYRPEVTTRVYLALADDAAKILAQGHSVMVDAVFSRAAERAAMAEVARRLKLPFHGLTLEAELPTRIARVSQRGPDASDATAEIARQQEAYAAEPNDWMRIDASGPPEQTLARGRAALADRDF